MYKILILYAIEKTNTYVQIIIAKLQNVHFSLYLQGVCVCVCMCLCVLPT